MWKMLLDWGSVQDDALLKVTRDTLFVQLETGHGTVFSMQQILNVAPNCKITSAETHR